MATSKQWADMTKEERDQVTRERREAAHELVTTGKFPPAIRVKIGEHTLFAKASGVSEKGNVSYSIAPMKLEVSGKTLRINRMSISVIGDGMPDTLDNFNEEDCL